MARSRSSTRRAAWLHDRRALTVDDAVDTGADGPEAPRRSACPAVATAVIVLDQATKHWAVNRLADVRSR